MIVAIALAAAISGAAADPAPPAPATTPPTAAVSSPSPYKSSASQKDPNKVVCRSEETTGSRLGAMRVCMTNAQWEERAAADKAVLDTTQQRSFTH
jgi:hypothetical protein